MWANGEIDLHNDDEIHSPPTKDKIVMDDGYDGDDDSNLNLKNLEANIGVDN